MKKNIFFNKNWIFLQNQLFSICIKNNIKNFFVPLTNLGLLEFSGHDAASFLHNQLTNSVKYLSTEKTQLAGYCSSKGKLLVTMILWKIDNKIILLFPYELLSSFQKKIKIFILRSKVKFKDITHKHLIFGLIGKKIAYFLKTWFPNLPKKPYDKIDNVFGTLIRITNFNEIPRYQWITANNIIGIKIWEILIKKFPVANTFEWSFFDIQSGIPQITLETQEKFIPQMINFELIGGIDFKKGCYPGQEIIARMQYLRKIKYRMMLAVINFTNENKNIIFFIKPGVNIFSEENSIKPCGKIVNTVKIEDNKINCLVKVKLDYIQNKKKIYINSVHRLLLVFQKLPYFIVNI
ncbi:folate-binding protein YgfZ [Candidatus Profftella armatura (Diaphorina cf. continua)]|uniref:Folate-binding protein YgfZ n=1 Tax=Candidatus Profftella armatura (Diaphorina cf. continua) TaxID=2661583 RepID=A0A7R6VYZ0_9PROT|nr:folate-binding protein YgfZ [Candidatus Profftella armatura (Diaphorina cf. continua)]BCG49733.1 folate-binding protein YgfZ [Candidatus Profftella armatura (Diaphorina cf. continua)]